MSNNPKIIFGELTGNSETQTETTHHQHWINLAKQTITKPELLKDLTIPNISDHPDRIATQIDEWIKPHTEFGESTDLNNKVGNLKYLSRVMYSDMFQISIPSEQGDMGIMSLGGVISHVDNDNDLRDKLESKGRYTRSIEEKYLLRCLNARKNVDEKIKKILNNAASDESIKRIGETLGIKDLDDSQTVESLFKATWEQLRQEEPEILKTSDQDTLQKYVDKLAEVRSIPEFQFIFSSPFWYEAVDIAVKNQEVRE